MRVYALLCKLDPRLLLHRLRTSTASHLLVRTTSTPHGPPTGSRLRPNAGGWRTGSLLAWTTSTLHGPPTGSRLRPAAGGLAHRKLAGADDLYISRAANRQPARAGCWGVGAQEACWRGRPLHCTGCQPAAGSGRRRGDGRAGCSRGRPHQGPGRQPEAGLAGCPGEILLCLRGSPFVRGPPPGSRPRLAAGGRALLQATGTIFLNL